MVAFREFLESTAPNEIADIDDLYPVEYRGLRYVGVPKDCREIDVFCPADECDELRHFDSTDRNWDSDPRMLRIPENSWEIKVFNYRCRYCRLETKRIALQIHWTATEDGGATFRAVKLGEWPPFGTHFPMRLVKLLRADRELLFKAKKALNAGLGIGSFGYYRRLVESQKVALFDEIIRTGRAIEVDENVIASLKAARDERQFSRSMELGRDAIPDKLLVVGRNPFTLLHEALSEGLHAAAGEDHAEADRRCLELAGAIEQVLVALTEDMHRLRGDRETLADAIRSLDRRNHPRGDSTSAGRTQGNEPD